MPYNFKLFFLVSLVNLSLYCQKIPKGFVFLSEEIPELVVELRYASKNNFMGREIKGYHIGQKIVGTYYLAKALKKVQIKLKKEGLGLKLFDAYRPQQAVDDFFLWSKNSSDTIAKQKYYPHIPKDSLFNYGYIASKSGHSRGSTIDLTLIYLFGEKRGQELDMGGNWDYFGKNSNYNFNLLSKKQKNNRKKLRNTMILNGFFPYEKEWWHFTLKNEPFPNKYFDFTP
tara:strand:+ start:241 stop:924 length:684 start_codon:yes stop_codon:yes gene_type:complete